MNTKIKKEDLTKAHDEFYRDEEGRRIGKKRKKVRLSKSYKEDFPCYLRATFEELEKMNKLIAQTEECLKGSSPERGVFLPVFFRRDMMAYTQNVDFYEVFTAGRLADFRAQFQER